MLSVFTKRPLLMLCIGVFWACEPENELPEFSSEEILSETFLTTKQSDKKAGLLQNFPSNEMGFPTNLQDRELHSVNPSECSPTKFTELRSEYFWDIASDPIAYERFEQYLFLNRQAAILGIGSNFFGRNGEYTKHVQKVKKDLERFWDIPREIRVLGQHNQTLNDREKLAEIFWYSVQDMNSKEMAYEMADEILRLNSRSAVLPESPFFSSDGFSALQGSIVIGDGLIQLFTETGLDDKIVLTGILSHEWAHQVQFQYLDSWYGNYAFKSEAEVSRTLELEADFFAGYYMTHKRGATFNWKRAEEFFELHYQSGDCSFEFEQHHGTPLQRKNASYEGFLLAQSSQKKGKILTPEILHNYFLQEVLPRTVAGSQYL